MSLVSSYSGLLTNVCLEDNHAAAYPSRFLVLRNPEKTSCGEYFFSSAKDRDAERQSVALFDHGRERGPFEKLQSRPANGGSKGVLCCASQPWRVCSLTPAPKGWSTKSAGSNSQNIDVETLIWLMASHTTRTTTGIASQGVPGKHFLP